MLAELACDPELRLDMNLMPGDIQFLAITQSYTPAWLMRIGPRSSESGTLSK
jgi:hypothetical protein